MASAGTAQTKKTILGVFAHPDDESMGPGGTFAKYAAAGHRVAFITATDGGAGRLYQERPEDNTELRKLRRQETLEAARILGIEALGFLGWADRELENMNVLDIELEVARIIRREKPDVLITFHGSGISRHPDHRVLAMAVNNAFMGSAHAGWYRDPVIEALPPHLTGKLYQYTVIKSLIEGVDWRRDLYASTDDEITAVIDTEAWADLKWKAIQAHDTQRDGPPFELAYRAGVFEKEAFVRVFPWPRPGDNKENDLLAGM
ncbi:MAG: PIG-L family deacetylase [Candidatus Krumholzibacteria bacterium]|nr:PIG-L family deacetylase [Candidatus Krumholzibacteria bacterium]